MEKLYEVQDLLFKWVLILTGLALAMLSILWLIKKLDPLTPEQREEKLQKRMDELLDPKGPRIKRLRLAVIFLVGPTIFVAFFETTRILLGLLLIGIGVRSPFILIAMQVIVFIYSGYVAFVAVRFIHRNLFVPEKEEGMQPTSRSQTRQQENP